MIEYARHVLGMKDADHAESNPETTVPVMAPLSCGLLQQPAGVFLDEKSALFGIYRTREITESYQCRFGVNPHYASIFSHDGLRIAGRDHAGEVRAVELAGHPFFMGTLFQPERSSTENRTHPLITAFVRACAGLSGIRA